MKISKHTAYIWEVKKGDTRIWELPNMTIITTKGTEKWVRNVICAEKGIKKLIFAKH
jgi:hypothetical protein